MNCEQMHELFSPYLDKMTSPQEAQSLEAHIKACPICRKQLEEMKVMCTLLKNLDTPQLPASFAEDLHKHLAQEKIKIFASPEVMVPKRPSWVAAGVAGIALTVGIYASTILPFGSMVASVQNWVNKDQDKPQIAVIENEKTIKDWAGKQTTEQINPVATVETNTGSIKNNTNPISPVALNATKLSPRPLTVANTGSSSVQPKIVDNYTAKVKTEDMNTSLQKLAQLANANGAQYSVQAANSKLTAATGSSGKIVSLQVPKENVDKVINDLAALGAGVPSKDSTNYTQAYAETEKTLADLQAGIQQLQSKSNLTAEEQAQLQQMENKQIDLISEEQRIDKEVNMVTVEVRLVEATDPSVKY